MNDLKLPDLSDISDRILRQAELYRENGADIDQINDIICKMEEMLWAQYNKINALPINTVQAVKEPNDLVEIKALRPQSNFAEAKKLPHDYDNRLAGALLGRSAGCTLGTIVEGWQIEDMKAWAHACRINFPPTDYFPSNCYIPEKIRCGISKFENYTPDKMNGIPCDDDLTYTVLGLLMLEHCGINLTTEDIAQEWIKYLPNACTAEKVVLENLKSGIALPDCTIYRNPYQHWIGAQIRSDPWGWVCPGKPEKAAELGFIDAMLTHRRTGIYGEMLFAAAQSAAFIVDNSLDAIRIGLSQIPKDCQLSDAIKWALNETEHIHDFEQARAAVDKKFTGLHWVHTINNACLVVLGLGIGNGDFSKTISETVAMGCDNDCTTATAGSIIGAIIGKEGIDKHWYTPFGDILYSYVIGHETLSITDVLARFKIQAEKVFACINET